MVLFAAHGNPMNAIRRNAFTRFLESWGQPLPRPRALLVVSAHWESRRLAVTSAERPSTIHDFGGFPEELYRLTYPAPGSPAIAARVASLLRSAGLEAIEDPRRGFDHGVWSPLLRLRPEADVPVVCLSLLHGVEPARHLEVGRALGALRGEGVLVMGSGNVVHNLATADLADEEGTPEAWAVEFDAWLRDRLDAWDLESLARFRELAPHGRMAHPTIEHYAPLLVVAGAASSAGAAGERPRVSYPFEGFEHRTIGLRCVSFE